MLAVPGVSRLQEPSTPKSVTAVLCLVMEPFLHLPLTAICPATAILPRHAVDKTA
jgi:hypothetical protein